MQNWSRGDRTAEPSSTQADPQTWYGQPETVYAAAIDHDGSGADSETSSDADSEELPQLEFYGSEVDAAEQISLQLRRARRVWRRTTGNQREPQVVP